MSKASDLRRRAKKKAGKTTPAKESVRGSKPAVGRGLFGLPSMGAEFLPPTRKLKI